VPTAAKPDTQFETTERQRQPICGCVGQKMVQTDDAFDAADRLSADPPAPWLLCAYDDSRSDRGLDRLCCWARAVVCNGERVVEACQTNTRTNIADTQFVLKVHQNKTSC